MVCRIKRFYSVSCINHLSNNGRNNYLIERYFNTLKTDLIYQHHYRTEKELYAAIEDFAYVHYNHVRPHAHNKYKMPYEAPYGVK